VDTALLHVAPLDAGASLTGQYSEF
jgi:hypothetical protein